MKIIVQLIMTLSCALSPWVTIAQTPVLLRTFNNPTPAVGDNFGQCMAALGQDRVLIGAPYDDTYGTNAGVAYLFHTNGTLLTTFTNPHPTISYSTLGDWFGKAISTLGNDLVVIGAPYEGKVYLFTTNGSLVTNLTPSNQSDSFSFGAAVSAFGNDRILIGAPESNWDNNYYDWFGAAYLYSTNGSLLATFSNPDRPFVFGLGCAAAVLGNDRVLIGASGYDSGAAYLYNTNGTLLMTFTNPAPSHGDYFGKSVVVAGTDRVLVSAPAFGTNTGAVYLFNTNATLLMTISNPTPASYDNFAWGMAMLGSDRVVIGAPGDDTTGTNAGSAYVFDINGTLLATLNNPSPAGNENFGWSLASFGSEGVIIGAPWHQGVGSAYLFSVPASTIAPSLTIQRTTTNTVVVSWPSSATGFVLQQNTNGVSSVNWSDVEVIPSDDGTNKIITISPGSGNRFFRLVEP